jgi:hypothetical protein
VRKVADLCEIPESDRLTEAAGLESTRADTSVHAK